MKSSHFSVILLLLISLVLISPACAAKLAAPDPWSPYQVFYQPYNSSVAKNLTIQNSTYIVDESGLVPVEWFVLFFCFAAIFLLAALFVEANNDLTPTIAAVLYYLLAYQAQYLSYHEVIPVLDSAATAIYMIPYTEVYHLYYVSFFCLALALIMTVLAIARWLRAWKDISDKKGGGALRLQDFIVGRD